MPKTQQLPPPGKVRELHNSPSLNMPLLHLGMIERTEHNGKLTCEDLSPVVSFACQESSREEIFRLGPVLLSRLFEFFITGYIGKATLERTLKEREELSVEFRL